jgi:hypothetical protein
MSLRNLPQEKLEKELKKRGIPVEDVKTYEPTAEGVRLYMRNGREIEIKDESLRMYARAAIDEALLKELVGEDGVERRLYAIAKCYEGYPFSFEHFKKEYEERILKELMERENIIRRLLRRLYALIRGYDSLLNQLKKEYRSEIQNRLWEMLEEKEKYLKDYFGASQKEFRNRLQKRLATAIQIALLKRGVGLPAGIGGILEERVDTQQLTDLLTDLYREKCPLSPSELVDRFLREVTYSHVKEGKTPEDSFLPNTA